MIEVVQVRLSSGTAQRTCWVPTAKRSRVGTRITLKNSEDPEQLWDVLSVGEPRDLAEVRSDWKVGGL